MKYVIMNRQAFDRIKQYPDENGLWNDTLFYVGPTISRGGPFYSLGWTNEITEAKQFDSEDDAWSTAGVVWGDGFADVTFMVISVPEKVANGGIL